MARINLAVTGLTGFIGIHLKEHLIKKNITFIPFTGDLLNKETVASFFKKNDITHVVHLAGAFIGSFETLIQKNVVTTQNLLEIGTGFNLKKIIFVSSGAVYGEPLNRVSREEDQLNPNTFYGLSKLFAEKLIEYYFQNYSIGFTILRFSSVYGEGNRKGVIYNFLNDIQKKGQVTIAGDGRQRRNFLHVTDACLAIEKAIFYKESDIFNIAPHKNYSLLELVQLLSKKYQFSISYKEADNPLKNLILDIKKARNKLHFSAKVKSLKSIL